MAKGMALKEKESTHNLYFFVLEYKNPYISVDLGFHPTKQDYKKHFYIELFSKEISKIKMTKLFLKKDGCLFYLPNL